MKYNKFLLITLLLMLFVLPSMTFAEDNMVLPSFNLSFGDGDNNVDTSIQILILITILSLAPSILIMMTSFTRFVIVFSFLRKAISLQTTPPNQVIIGLSLFMTLFIMSPVLADIKTEAYDPFVANEINQKEALDNASKPIKQFMLKQVRTNDLGLFVELSKEEYDDVKDLPLSTIIPAFIISELKTGFEIGFLLFIPFIVIDMIVASTLMSLGMMMLPPVMISLPFKILLFIMVDGWHLIVEQLLRTIK